MSVRKFSSASIASAAIKSSKLWDQETFPGTFESISTAIVDSSGASTIDFTNIPQNYTSLQIRLIGRTDRAGSVLDYFKLQFNSDTSTNYSWHELYGDGNVGTQGGTSANEIRLFRATGASAGASMFGVSIIDIIDYANTSKFKTVKSLGGGNPNTTVNGDTEISLTSGNWRNTNAITSIQLKPGGGTNWVQYSNFALYGIRGA